MSNTPILSSFTEPTISTVNAGIAQVYDTLVAEGRMDKKRADQEKEHYQKIAASSSKNIEEFLKRKYGLINSMAQEKYTSLEEIGAGERILGAAGKIAQAQSQENAPSQIDEASAKKASEAGVKKDKEVKNEYSRRMAMMKQLADQPQPQGLKISDIYTPKVGKALGWAYGGGAMALLGGAAMMT